MSSNIYLQQLHFFQHKIINDKMVDTNLVIFIFIILLQKNRISSNFKQSFNQKVLQTICTILKSFMNTTYTSV